MLPVDLLRDPLTGALTRHHFDDLLAESLARAAADYTTLALLVVDLDHFKSINDSFGHPRGDAVLVELVRRLHQALRPADRLFRFGGDEFVVLLPSTSAAQALVIAQQLLTNIDCAPFAGTPPLNLTLSIGLACFPADADTPADLLRAADRRLYHAKRLGRGRVSSADSGVRLAGLLTPARLVDRDEPLAIARDVLQAQDAALRTVCIQAEPGAGRTRFLAEITRAAVTLGYATLSVSGSPALRARHFGALTAAAAAWPLPSPAGGAEPFATALAAAIQARGATRLLITVDDPAVIDTHSLELLRDIARASALSHVLLVYIDGPVWARRLTHDPLRQFALALTPLGAQGVTIWLRQALRWEPPASLVEWMLGYSGGYPGRVQRGLDELLASGALASPGESWTWDVNLALGIAPYAPRDTPLQRTLASAPLLIGRDAEIAALRNLLLTSRVVTIAGQGGVGKTRLALQVAAECAADFRDGVHLVALAGVQHAAHILAAISAALQLPPLVNQDTVGRLVAHLRGREALLLLDNAEHLVDGVGVLNELLFAAPNVRLLVTSRVALDLSEEQVTALDGLAIPADEQQVTAAVDLFYQRARQVNPAFAPTAADQRAIGRICQLLHGLPLGIELAASFCQTYSCAAILAEIGRSLSFLTDTRAEIVDRHRSLTAVLESFWQILSVHERRALQTLAVFRGGFTRAAAREVAEASPFFLDGLTARTVLRRTPSGRFTIHELVRQYALDKLHARPKAATRAADRHSAYILAQIARHYARPEQGAAQPDPGLELNNVRAAWEWAVANGRVARVADAAPAFFTLLFDLGLLREALTAGEAARLALEPECRATGREDLLALLEVLRGLAFYHNGQYSAAIAAAEQALATLGERVAAQVRARCYFTIGTSMMVLGQQAQAQRELERALAVVDGDNRLAVEILYTITHLANLAGDSARADAYGPQALARARRSGDTRAEHQTLLFVGIGEIFRERHSAARAHLEPIISEGNTTRQMMTQILAFANLAQSAWEVHEYRRAAAEVERAIALARTADMRYLEGIGLRVRGLVALSTGRLVQAEAAFAEALHVFQTANAERDVARAYTEQALLAAWRGTYAAAAEAAAAALTIARAQRFLPVMAHALIHQGHAQLGLGAGAAAGAAYAEAQTLLHALARPNRAAEALAGLVEVALLDNDAAAARQRGADLWAHLQRGPAALGGMYDPVRVCLAAYDALLVTEPTAAAAALDLARQTAEAIVAQVPPERACEDLAHVPSLRRLVQLTPTPVAG